MTIHHKPENTTKTNEARPSLGKLDTPDYPEWVVVENAGEDNEDIWADFNTYAAAIRELKECGGRENGFDIMKRLANGMLTTEF